VIVLSGEADLTTVAQLSELVTGQMSGRTRYLMIDAAGLRFADMLEFSRRSNACFYRKSL